MSSEGDLLREEIAKLRAEAAADRARIARLEKGLDDANETAIMIGQGAATIKDMRRVTNAPRLQAVCPPGMKIASYTERGERVLEALPPPTPATDTTWRPNPNSDDPAERAYAESLANDGRTTPRAVESNGIDAALALQSELHTAFKGQK